MLSLVKWGYTPESAANQLHLIAHLSCWLAGERLDVHTFRANDLQRYFQFRRHTGCTHCVSMKATLPTLTYLKAEGSTFAAANGLSRGPIAQAHARRQGNRDTDQWRNPEDWAP